MKTLTAIIKFNNINRSTFIIAVLCVLLPLFSHAQQLSKAQDWQLLDYKTDSVYGTSVNRAYAELLKGKKSKPVIVAVIDEGVDITHQDLQGHIWTNTKEITGNGIDDDKNGYIDDVHGWNFLGGKDGRNIYATNSEADREYGRLLPEFKGKTTDEAKQMKDYGYFIKVKKEHIADSVGRTSNYIPQITAIFKRLERIDSTIKKAQNKTIIYNADIAAYQPTDSNAIKDKKYLLALYVRNPLTWKGISVDSIVNIGKVRIADLKQERILYSEVKADDPLAQRRNIVGDNPLDINDRNYGNNKVGDQYADHGTHCSCIIGADRGNEIGIKGIADNVIIMPVRAVNTLHYGDEMDKDIALAIRYAVDNGAQIISMSFGKDLSPQKKWVDEAIKYADKKGVLMVHAAGNDGKDIDTAADFPSPNYVDGSGHADNMITVGSMSSDTGLTLPASDSNFGQKNVDLFAQGVSIYSCIPGNKYDFKSGTSMAAPEVAGVAALLLEYYPQLTAAQVKDIIMRSVVPLRGKIVYRPGSKEKVDFATLSITGGVLNAYNALQLAQKITSGK